MAGPRQVKDIMVRQVVCCHPQDTLGALRKIMKEREVRHVPVVNPGTDEFVGLVTQKALLRATFLAINRFGVDDLAYQENKKTVDGIMVTSAETVDSDLSLAEAGRILTASRQGCLPVVDGSRLVGILTSSDFVRLSLALLGESGGA